MQKTWSPGVHLQALCHPACGSAPDGSHSLPRFSRALNIHRKLFEIVPSAILNVSALSQRASELLGLVGPSVTIERLKAVRCLVFSPSPCQGQYSIGLADTIEKELAMLDLNSPESDARGWCKQEIQPEEIYCHPNLDKDYRLAPSGDPDLNPAPDSSRPIEISECGFGPMIGKSRSLREAFEKMARTAPSNANVIIYGETGTGKELAAQTIHRLSPRRRKRFVPVNCGAIPEELIESEFFGYKKGAFTGAGTNKPGYLDWAHKGTLFLDEVGELSPAMQVKLLRAVDGGGYAPIGSQDVKKTDIRIIAATNNDLGENVCKGSMREDFYYRIHVLPIWLPPLRERKDDLPLLINHFLVRSNRGQTLPILPEKMMSLLKNYHWPGNIRELQNTIQRYVTLKEIGFLQSHQEIDKTTPEVFSEFSSGQDLKSALEEFEKQYILHCLKATGWHKSKSCAILKINRKTLYKKMKRYHLKRIYGEKT
jgi:transcriptional regulator with AAA-type ATPase domain